MASAGKTLLQALHDKYDDNVEEENSFCQIYVPKSAPGIKDSGKMILPRQLALDYSQIDSAGNPSEIAEVCVHVEELDLTKNLLKSWNEVFTIAEQMPALHFLNLTFNDLADITFPEDYTQQYRNVTVLVLNGVQASWQTVQKVLHTFPSLRELHLSLNCYTDIQLDGNTRTYTNLTSFHFYDCNVREWSDIEQLGRVFPCLQSMNILKNNIQTIDHPECLCELFPKLDTLNISDTNLQCWKEVDKLRLLPALTKLRISGMPFMEGMVEKDRCVQLLARLPALKYLNGSTVKTEDRDAAERAFIRLYMDENEKPLRYDELEAVHGKLEQLVDIDFSLENWLKMKVVFEDKEEMMDVDVAQTVRQFKKLLKKFCGLPPSKFRLFVMDNKNGLDIMPIEVVFEDKEEMMDIDVAQTVRQFKKLLKNFCGLPPSKFRLFVIDNEDGFDMIPNEVRGIPNKVLRSLRLNKNHQWLVLRL